MTSLIDKIYFLWKKGSRLESKFASYQGYRPESIILWKQQTGLPWSIVFKILDEFEIYTAPKIRILIRQVVTDNENLFSRENCYVTGFGNAGKSGDIILYDFSHTTELQQSRIIKTWQINTLPPNSTIIFIEDIIGTGTQSVDYIQTKLNQVLAPSHEPYLFSLCASPQGLSNVESNTNFKVIYGQLLEASQHQYYSEECTFFDSKEKAKLISVNGQLKNPNAYDFDLGLMLAFYFTIPNNAMPIFWKDNYNYTDRSGNKKQWTALLPRRF